MACELHPEVEKISSRISTHNQPLRRWRFTRYQIHSITEDTNRENNKRFHIKSKQNARAKKFRKPANKKKG